MDAEEQLEWHRRSDIELLATRASMGDVAHVERQIDHVALFRRRSLADRAAAELSAAGYTVEQPERRGLRVQLASSKGFDRLGDRDLGEGHPRRGRRAARGKTADRRRTLAPDARGRSSP